MCPDAQLGDLSALPYLSSLQNPHIKRLVRLRARKEREQEQVMLVEGGREAQRAYHAGIEFQEVYVCPELFSPDSAQFWVSHALLHPSSATLLSRVAFEKVSGRENPDGVLCVCTLPALQLPEVCERALVLVLHGLEKPGNVGAIVRTADAVGASAVLILGRGADPYSPNVIRASQGSVFHVPTLCIPEEQALTWLSAQQFGTVACTPDAQQDYWDAPLGGKVALLLGTEHEGLPEHWRQAHTAVRIPMFGEADSLNVATAAALVMYECVRQRRVKSG